MAIFQDDNVKIHQIVKEWLGSRS